MHLQGPYDGLGGTLKRLTAKASLQRTTTNQIIQPLEVFNFCRENVTGIHCMWVGNDTVEELYREKLEARYSLAKQIRGTQTFHQFDPVPNTTKVIVKYVSSDIAGFEKQTSR